MAKIRILAFDLNGRKVGRIVGQKTLDSNATLEEAIRNGYVVGQLSSVKGNVDGVMRRGKGSDLIATVNCHSRSCLWYNFRHEEISRQPS